MKSEDENASFVPALHHGDVDVSTSLKLIFKPLKTSSSERLLPTRDGCENTVEKQMTAANNIQQHMIKRNLNVFGQKASLMTPSHQVTLMLTMDSIINEESHRKVREKRYQTS